jgi:hypothetical protein
MRACLPCGCLLLTPICLIWLINAWVKSNQEKEKRRFDSRFQGYSVHDKKIKIFLLRESGAELPFEKYVYKEAFNTAREVYDYLYGKDGKKKSPYSHIQIYRKHGEIFPLKYDSELTEEQYISHLEELMFEKRAINQIEDARNLKIMPTFDDNDNQQIIQR